MNINFEHAKCNKSKKCSIKNDFLNSALVSSWLVITWHGSLRERFYRFNYNRCCSLKFQKVLMSASVCKLNDQPKDYVSISIKEKVSYRVSNRLSKYTKLID